MTFSQHINEIPKRNIPLISYAAPHIEAVTKIMYKNLVSVGAIR